ncbi:hypothetical protein K2X92_05490 [Candidatus Gracilibacteria bacterium]|nr:hypothetical protein [Candidatus Gracilibacteria bacterium]
MPINKKNQKDEARAVLLRHLELPKSTRAVVVTYIKNPEILEFLTRACESIGVSLVTDHQEMVLSGADIWISDYVDDSIPVEQLSKKRVVPVVPVAEKYKDTFSEFDPMKFTGNSFIFQEVNQFQMFEKLIRALENMRYAGDKRMLLENVETIKL